MTHYLTSNLTLTLASSFIASVGIVNDNTPIVIGSMLIAPLGSIIVDYFRKPNVTNLKTFVISLFAALAVGYITHYALFKFRGEVPEKTKELEDRASDLYEAFLPNLLIGIAIGIAIETVPSSATVQTGSAISASLVPPLVSSGMFLNHYAQSQKDDELQNSINAFGIFVINAIGIYIGLHTGTLF